MKLLYQKIKHFFAKMQDILVADFLYLPPCIFKWLYHRRIKKDIVRYRLRGNDGKKASLYQHGSWKTNPEGTQATLILHGLYGHPLVMLPVAKMAQDNTSGPVFSFYVSYEQVNLETHRQLIQQALDRIESIVKNGNSELKGIVMVGHSMGAIEAAYRAFVENDKRILSVISIAGRLKVVDSALSPCRESLKTSVNQIFEGIQSHPNIPLYQIVADKDWNASLEATLIRNDQEFYHIIDAMHFNILFHKEMRDILQEYLKKSKKNMPLEISPEAQKED